MVCLVRTHSKAVVVWIAYKVKNFLIGCYEVLCQILRLFVPILAKKMIENLFTMNFLYGISGINEINFFQKKNNMYDSQEEHFCSIQF